MTEAIERIASVIEAAIERHGVPLELMEGTLDDARAALLALREPTEEMVDSMFKAKEYGMTMGEAATAMWQAGIDAALSAPQGGE